MNGFSGLSALDANRAWVGDGSGVVVEYLAGANSLTTMFSVKPDLAIGFAPAGAGVFVLTRGGISLRSGATTTLVWSLPFAGLPAKPTGGQIEVLGGRYLVSVPDLGRIFDVSDGVAVEWAKMSSPYSMAADGDRMFVVKAPPPAGIQVVMDTPMSVIEFDSSGTELSVVVEEPYGVGRLAAAGGELVWARLCSTKQVGSALMRRTSDGTVEVLADDKTFSCQISFAYADDGIYWTNVSASGAAELRRVRRL